MGLRVEEARVMHPPASWASRGAVFNGVVRSGLNTGQSFGGSQQRDQILPTRSSEGARVLAPSFHLAGQTWPGLAAVYWAALSLRRVSETSRAISLECTSAVLMTPSGLITKVPRRARPSSSMCTPKARVSLWVGSPTRGNWALPTAGEVSCHTLSEKWVSVVTM